MYFWFYGRRHVCTFGGVSICARTRYGDAAAASVQNDAATSLQRHAQAIAATALYWLRRVLDDGERQH